MSGLLDRTTLLEPVSSRRTVRLGKKTTVLETCADFADSVTVIACGQLRANDQILIHTEHSTYIFLVIDPIKPLGLVVGGVFGDYAAKVFLDTMPMVQDCVLQTGRRVIFHAATIFGHKRVTTSVITELVYRPANTKPLSQ
jgi:hypothetical protein